MPDSPFRPYTLDPGEKATPVMMYTLTTLARGDLISRDFIKIAAWLRTPGAPDFMPMKNVQVVSLAGAGPVQTFNFPEYCLATPQILAYHPTPPVSDPPDYDPSEPNRKMEPVTVLVGAFRFNGLLRMAMQMTLHKHMELIKEIFFNIYEVEISSPSLAGTVIKVPMAFIRSGTAIIGARQPA